MGLYVPPGTIFHRSDKNMVDKIHPEVAEALRNIPEGCALVRHVYNGGWNVFDEYYSVPAGTVVDGVLVNAGEFVAAHDSYRYNWIAPDWYVEGSKFVLGRPAQWTTYLHRSAS